MEGPTRYCNLIQTVKKYKSLCNQIIISSYLSQNLIEKLKQNVPNIIIINNDYDTVRLNTEKKYPKRRTCRRVKKGFEQFHHIYNALPLIKTPYVLKTRVDQFFSNLDYFIHTMINNDKVVMFPFYIRGALVSKCHPSDMLFGCSTKKMKEIFPLERVHQKFQLIERAIWTHWMFTHQKINKKKSIQKMNNHEYGLFCSELFSVVNEKKLVLYTIFNNSIYYNILNLFSN